MTLVELVALVAAGAAGAVLAVLLVGASLFLVLPAMVTVGAVSLVAARPRGR